MITSISKNLTESWKLICKVLYGWFCPFAVMDIGFMYLDGLLFEAYNYIASGLATTLIFLYPVLVAIIMVFLKVVPSWQVWLSIFATFAGVIVMTHSSSGEAINPIGILLSLGSAFVYAWFIVIINRSKVIGTISNALLTFYALLTGATIFLGKMLLANTGITTGISYKRVYQ